MTNAQRNRKLKTLQRLTDEAAAISLQLITASRDQYGLFIYTTPGGGHHDADMDVAATCDHLTAAQANTREIRRRLAESVKE